MKSMLSSAAPVISFARASDGSLGPTISCLSPPGWNIVLKISAMTLRFGFSSTARKAARPAQPPDPTQLEKSLAVLSKLKELEFHSRSNIEKLAELSLTIEEELKQRTFAEAIGAVYSAQDAFQSKILKLIEDYEAECDRLKPAG